MLKQLVHCGVLIPEKPLYHGMTIRIHGEEYKLDAKQEEMAFAWVRKLGTAYAEDRVFVTNFIADFSKALGFAKNTLNTDEIDFKSVYEFVIAEREAKAQLTKEQRKEIANVRKAKRDELKEKYGYAIADGERIELANYIVEPSCIFMGRGKHPLRGRWKEGADYTDITLNLSPDAQKPAGDWAEIVWQPESLWVAKWCDKLSGKLKYIWLHDTAPVKQAREAEKFDKAIELGSVIKVVREHIQKGLVDENPKRRRIASACYLIDALCLRVGDEKDPDEADTVGATTLRPEHIKFLDNGELEFKFLGKDSVLWHKKLNPPELVFSTLKDIYQNARPSKPDKNSRKHPVYGKPQLFPDVSSRNVNEFLSEVLPGLTAKVFRTNHASAVVQKCLDESNVVPSDPQHKKWEAVVRANIEAAILCNHTKQPPKNWAQRKDRFKERERKTKERLVQLKIKMTELENQIKALRRQHKERKKTARNRQRRNAEKQKFEKKMLLLTSTIQKIKLQSEKNEIALGKLKTQKVLATENRTWNLTTSQKSYIDPRVFYRWGEKVDYDVLAHYYSKTLQRKFLWVRQEERQEDDDAEEMT